ncbi:LAMI_0G13190g1_1 [Lachancea mirantina]|uniref:non-specific serine/threonine protein kinase n=1 Tax=Lachancea mirantina TaxID=1230905 RepID=A0A1G4KBS0_9SACH|nr:LAMI_0G13190g1_1 [Lachancea mirantina]
MPQIISEEEKPEVDNELKRSRSFSQSIKGLFKPGSPTRKTGGPTDATNGAGKNSDRLKKLAVSKEQELGGKRHEAAQNRAGDGNRPKMNALKTHTGAFTSIKNHTGIPEFAGLSLSSHGQARNPKENSNGTSQESLVSGEEAAKKRNRKAIPIDAGNDDDSDGDESSSRRENTIDEELCKDPREVRRSQSLQRKGSFSRQDYRSRSMSLNSRYRSRSPTFSASNLTQHSERHSKLVVNTETFQLYEDGHHEHTLKVTPLVHDSQEDGHKGKPGFSLSGFFKSHKDGENLESALSLLPRSRYEFHKRLSRIWDEELGDENDDKDDAQAGKDIPTPVNPEAAIGVEELKLINKLSKRIHDTSAKSATPVTSGNAEVMAKKTYTLCEKYGKSIGVIGHGAYGTVKVVCKMIAPSEEERDITETYKVGNKLYYAVKELKPKGDEPKEKFGTRLTSEFIIGHSLSRGQNSKEGPSPNILRMLDLMQTNDGFVEVLEFCPSGDLYSLLSRASRSGSGLHPLETDCFMKQLLNGVQYMHDHGIAHCDLKPENLLFQPGGILKIADFGTSCVFQTAWEKQVHFQTGAVGSEPYVAPEEFIENREYDPRLVDCWSCGVIYCTMVLGHYLWKVPLLDKDSVYASFVEQIRTKKEYAVFEEMRHVSTDINRYRKSCLYNIFQWHPDRRISIDKLLQSPWMKRTRCCVFYKDHSR